MNTTPDTQAPVAQAGIASLEDCRRMARFYHLDFTDGALTRQFVGCDIDGEVVPQMAHIARKALQHTDRATVDAR